MSSVSVKISGQDKVNKKLAALLSEKMQNVVEAVEVTQALIVNDAKSIVPVKTGFLQSSIGAGEVFVDARKGQVDGEVVANADYASHVEFGTSRQKAQPYMIPSVMKNRAKFLSRLKAAVAA